MPTPQSSTFTSLATEPEEEKTVILTTSLGYSFRASLVNDDGSQVGVPEITDTGVEVDSTFAAKIVAQAKQYDILIHKTQAPKVSG